jgi:hypothetical protein
MDIIGFLLIKTNIPEIMAKKEAIYKNISLNPLVKISFKTINVNIIKKKPFNIGIEIVIVIIFIKNVIK